MLANDSSLIYVSFPGLSLFSYRMVPVKTAVSGSRASADRVGNSPGISIRAPKSSQQRCEAIARSLKVDQVVGAVNNNDFTAFSATSS